MDFKTFLIEKSNIKKSFINDFFEIIREDYFELSEKFLISSNKLQIWLNISSRKDFHDTIKRRRKAISSTSSEACTPLIELSDEFLC